MLNKIWVNDYALRPSINLSQHPENRLLIVINKVLALLVPALFQLYHIDLVLLKSMENNTIEGNIINIIFDGKCSYTTL